jgi:Zn ribbon nucleic-acid-binding protein
LGKDSLSEYGEAKFDHETHAEAKYSPDGKSVLTCVECHHTDQPKSALKPPLKTSEREVALTMATWQASNQKVNECRACHFQEGNVPDGKEMPELNGKALNNEYSYHVNCNTCHDAAFKARPELKGKKGFATSKDCLICHVKN